jgi:hypothetical protein
MRIWKMAVVIVVATVSPTHHLVAIVVVNSGGILRISSAGVRMTNNSTKFIVGGFGRVKDKTGFVAAAPDFHWGQRLITSYGGVGSG